MQKWFRCKICFMSRAVQREEGQRAESKAGCGGTGRNRERVDNRPRKIQANSHE